MILSNEKVAETNKCYTPPRTYKDDCSACGRALMARMRTDA